MADFARHVVTVGATRDIVAVGWQQCNIEQRARTWLGAQQGSSVDSILCRNRTWLWGELLERLIQVSGDPDTDTEVATWPRLGAPLGILDAVLFAKWEEKATLDSSQDLDGAGENYKSYKEARQDVDALFGQGVRALKSEQGQA